LGFCQFWEYVKTWNSTLLAGPLLRWCLDFAFDLHRVVVNLAAKENYSAFFSAPIPSLNFSWLFTHSSPSWGSFSGTQFYGYLPLAVGKMDTVALGLF
jgi:hypothetical protein